MAKLLQKPTRRYHSWGELTTLLSQISPSQVVEVYAWQYGTSIHSARYSGLALDIEGAIKGANGNRPGIKFTVTKLEE